MSDVNTSVCFLAEASVCIFYLWGETTDYLDPAKYLL